ncbi:hypothetical protein [Tianweitania sediminis]|uniref:Uncharacterized protein n=1 Tax=Tianweitania sediminis TaxID=1502156 RepID=A0A8J7ULL4_9HYPH|nr:hypothetical protein [Tianweitania sediminis]MBP0439552.1 hypothetical protein [Tianweitania sediminis]
MVDARVRPDRHIKSRTTRVYKHAYDPWTISSSTPAQPLQFEHQEVDRSQGNLTPLAKPNDERSLKYYALYEAIRRMARLPKGHDFHIDTESAKHAEELLAVFATNFKGRAPKMFAQDGEAVVLTWDFDVLKRYLTIAGQELDLMDIGRASKMRCDYELDYDKADDFRKLLLLFGDEPLSETDPQDLNAAR